MTTEAKIKAVTEELKRIFDQMIEFEKIPVDYRKDAKFGWAAYRGDVRISRFHFSEEATRKEVRE